MCPTVGVCRHHSISMVNLLKRLGVLSSRSERLFFASRKQISQCCVAVKHSHDCAVVFLIWSYRPVPLMGAADIHLTRKLLEHD